MRSPSYHYWTLRVHKDSWLAHCVTSEDEAKNAVDRIPRMLRIRLEASYEQSDAKINPDELTERVVSAVRERIDKMVLNTQPLARDERIIEPGASKNDLDNLLELFNREE